jgi:hypothetical protein
MAAVVFLLGTAAIIFGFVIILSREYQETLKVLSAQSMRVSAKAITEDGVGPVLAGMSQLLDSVRKLVATAVGVGVFLALLGVGMTALGYWMLTAGS